MRVHRRDQTSQTASNAPRRGGAPSRRPRPPAHACEQACPTWSSCASAATPPRRPASPAPTCAAREPPVSTPRAQAYRLGGAACSTQHMRGADTPAVAPARAGHRPAPQTHQALSQEQVLQLVTRFADRKQSTETVPAALSARGGPSAHRSTLRLLSDIAQALMRLFGSAMSCVYTVAAGSSGLHVSDSSTKRLFSGSFSASRSSARVACQHKPKPPQRATAGSLYAHRSAPATFLQ